MSCRLWLARKLDPDATYRERELRRRIFNLRDTLEQVAWRQAMNLRSVDQKAAHRMIHMRLSEDAK